MVARLPSGRHQSPRHAAAVPGGLSDNYEFGWKTEWLDHHLRWNGAVFQENWKDFQFAMLGANGLTEIKNANQARIRGFESNLGWAATYNLTITAGSRCTSPS